MAGQRVVRVVPDVAGLPKAFDYIVPDSMAELVEVGTSVRVLLNNRRVAGWVVADHVDPPDGVTLRPLLAVRGIGPPAPVVDLAQWAAWRWAGPASRLLRTASSPTLVHRLPSGSRSSSSSPTSSPPASGVTAELVRRATQGGPVVVRLAPGHDPLDLVDGVLLASGPVGAGEGALVLAPERSGAETVAGALRRRGHAVALLPEQWATARAGGVVAVGSRAAAFAPLPAMGTAVVLDAHDEAYHEERAPTWCAWQVAAERARREGRSCVLVSPCPTLDVLAAGPLVTSGRADERAGWPAVEVVDRRSDDPRTGLYSSRLVEVVRWAAEAPRRRVVCVLNRIGRARLLVCSSCGEVARCEHCGAAVGEGSDPSPEKALECRRCGRSRPSVCAQCGSVILRKMRVGVSRAREELEALAGTPVAEVTAGGDSVGPPSETAAVVVGTEAVLHRPWRADVVAFLDFDGEVLAPRLRAGEEALALLARAARMMAIAPDDGGRPLSPGPASRAPGRLLVQTRLPRHPALLSAVSADPSVLSNAEAPVRTELRLPPTRAMAVVSGQAAAEFAERLRALSPTDVELRGPVDGSWSVLASDADALADVLAAVPRPAGRLRVEVDPVRT